MEQPNLYPFHNTSETNLFISLTFTPFTLSSYPDCPALQIDWPELQPEGENGELQQDHEETPELYHEEYLQLWR